VSDGGLDAARRRHPSARSGSAAQFAHPSEQLFARLLDLYEVRWAYEPYEFALDWHPDGSPKAGFRPDFYLPDLHLLVELTAAEQRLVTKKNRKVRRFRSLYPELELVLLYQRDLLALCAAHGLTWSSERAA